MKQPGQIVLFKFSQTDLTEGKLRPALLLGELPGKYDDWLICMISSQTRHGVEGFDEIMQPSDADFAFGTQVDRSHPLSAFQPPISNRRRRGR
ncbi:MAG: hypothetical protein AB1817_08885 [Chloroflexota bacterium]